jgi:hypothetical protein
LTYDVLLAGGALLRIRLGVPHLGHVGVLVERVVVDREPSRGASPSPSGVTISGLISQSIASAPTSLVELRDDCEDLLLLIRVSIPAA